MEPLINSGTFNLLTQIHQLKARIAANSGTIGKIRNTEMMDLRRKVMFHELIRGSLDECGQSVREDRVEMERYAALVRRQKC